MATYIKPNAIKDASIEGIKIKDGTISSSKIDGTVASKSYVDTQVKLANNAVQITYSELKSLRDAGKLVPGTQYRITDYTCTTAQEDTRSAGHQFDIIVTADSMNKLNENARAIQNEEDTYFADSKLESWELKYCLDNDTTRFSWALQSNKYMTLMDPWGGDPFDVKYVDTKNISGITYDLWRYDLMTADTYYGTKSLRVGESVVGITNHGSDWEVAEGVAIIQAITEHGGKGVIYWMKDEYDNECPYDFKNIQFKRYAVTNVTSSKLTSDALNNLKSILVKDSNGGLYFATKDSYGNFVPSNVDGASYEINENDFNWYYTFQGISSADGSTINKMYDLTVETFKLTDECISYLENNGTGADTEDYCRENKIEQFNQEYFTDSIYYKGRQILNNIVFIGGLNYCYENENSSWEYNSTSQIYSNRFGVNCNSNTFGNDCTSNSFGNNCYSNTFGRFCTSNSFGNNCASNSFGRFCSSNSFGNFCTSNSFGNFCTSNSFGNDCSSNSFGNNCSSNSFGNRFRYNTFGNDIQESQFGDDVQYFSITTQQMTTNPASSYLKNYIRWLIVENGVRYVNAYVTGSTSSSVPCQNVRICLGIQGVSYNNRKTFDITSCINSKLNNVYQPENSQTTSV